MDLGDYGSDSDEEGPTTSPPQPHSPPQSLNEGATTTIAPSTLTGSSASNGGVTTNQSPHSQDDDNQEKKDKKDKKDKKEKKDKKDKKERAEKRSRQEAGLDVTEHVSPPLPAPNLPNGPLPPPFASSSSKEKFKSGQGASSQSSGQRTSILSIEGSTSSSARKLPGFIPPQLRRPNVSTEEVYIQASKRRRIEDPSSSSSPQTKDQGVG